MCGGIAFCAVRWVKHMCVDEMNHEALSIAFSPLPPPLLVEIKQPIIPCTPSWYSSLRLHAVSLAGKTPGALASRIQPYATMSLDIGGLN